jgi:flagellar biosynthesis protein FliP
MFIQIFFVILFISLSSLFFSFFHKTNPKTNTDVNQCFFYTQNSLENKNYTAHTTADNTTYLFETTGKCYNQDNTTTDCPGAKVTQNFMMLFMFGGIIFLLDAFCRCFIVFGLFKRSIWF